MKVTKGFSVVICGWDLPFGGQVSWNSWHNVCKIVQSVSEKPPQLVSLWCQHPFQITHGKSLAQTSSNYEKIAISCWWINFSQYPEVVKLTSTISSAVIAAMKAVFSWHGIPVCFLCLRESFMAKRNLATLSHNARINAVLSEQGVALCMLV